LVSGSFQAGANPTEYLGRSNNGKVNYPPEYAKSIFAELAHCLGPKKARSTQGIFGGSRFDSI
jgi:hypothetical protein